MGIFNKLFNSGDLVKEVGNVVDNLTTSDQERLEAKKQIKEVVLDYEKTMQVEVSKRWEYDMKSDSWLSKNVRPLTLVFFSLSYVIGWFAKYPLEEISGVLSIIIAAYFGSRGVEKFSKIKNN